MELPRIRRGYIRADREEDRAVVAVGGHPLPLYVTQDCVTVVGEHGPLLGALSDVRWSDVTHEIVPGGMLLTYTDGVTDAVGEDGTRFGFQRLWETLAECRGCSAEGVIERLTAERRQFQVRAHADDTAALALRRRSPPVAALGMHPGAAIEPKPTLR